MPRRARAISRQTPTDTKYDSEIIAGLISKIMTRGKKSLAERIVYGAMDTIEKQGAKEPVNFLEQAVRNATPQLEVKPRRVGGATYQVPVEVRPERGRSLALRWLVASARARAGKSMVEKLAAELSDAFQGQGTTIKKREDTHKMAEANRAFAHYRW
jgi:small subunit ribosomal protein S7